MTEDVENHTLELLRVMRNELQSLRVDVRDGFTEIRARLGRIELAIARVARDETQNYSELIADRHVMDKLKERVDRIERRLELEP